MQASVFYEYGAPTVLKTTETKKPKPTRDQVLIQLKASSINDWDWGILQGKPFVNKMLSGFGRPTRINTLGSDIAGVVIAVGRNITQFSVGDEVFGDLCGKRWGGFAEYVVTTPEVLTLKPAFLSFEAAAALPQAATIALQGLSGKNQPKSGDNVLINGAGGGSGSFAIQIAKSYGAIVTAVDSSAKQAFMTSLGADKVIDYEKENFTQNGKHYDLILDLMGHHSIFSYQKRLKKAGRYVMVGGASRLILQTITLGSLISMFSKKSMTLLMHEPMKGIDKLKELIAENKLKVVIDKCFNLEQVPEAMTYFGERRSLGKVVIITEQQEAV